MIKKRFLSMLVLLMTAVTGATAQTEELLTTITMSGDGIIAYSVSGRATLSTSGLVETGMVAPEVYGWSNSSPLGIGSVTITAAEGYEITKVVFWNYDFMGGYNKSITDNASPFTCYLKSSMRSLNEDMSSGSSGNIAKIEVYGYAATVAVTGVTLAPTSATLTLGETETVTLIPTVLPGDATDKSVTWSSSNEAVATVADGVVTAVAAGEATITVTTTDGAKTATCAVTVAAPAASTYTVTLKEGTEDATSWTIAPDEATTTGVAAGTEVKATYSGTKKVKSVKAKKKAKPAATVTTAPTAKTGVKAGEDVAIVNEGTAEGGTMMYMVNATQPASTDGFSATVPTAEGLTAGTYYVWYYVKADDSHTDSEISASGIEVTIAAAAPTLAETLTTAGMTVKVNFNYADEENYCLFVSNGDGTYTFQSGGGYVGGNDNQAKALVVENGKLVFKQDYDGYWEFFGFSVTFDTSNNTYIQWKGEYADDYNPSFISVEVNGTQIAVTQQ